MGDVAPFGGDGYLYLTDRSANLIISGGVNVYPAEVDAVLLEHAAVGDAGTIGVPDPEWGEAVTAVVALPPGLAPSDGLPGELLAHCRDRPAHFKCPRRGGGGWQHFWRYIDAKSHAVVDNRFQIAQMIGCEFCSRQTSPPAGITEEEKTSCALPSWEHPDARTRAALHFARTLTLDDGRDREVYEELHRHYSNAEIIELSAFFMLTMGGNRMAKSWTIEPHGEVSAIPEGALSVHATR